jgi:hypothetical protein
MLASELMVASLCHILSLIFDGKLAFACSLFAFDFGGGEGGRRRRGNTPQANTDIVVFTVFTGY